METRTIENLKLAEIKRIDRLCDSFEQELKRGYLPDIQVYLQGYEPASDFLAEELVQLTVTYLRRQFDQGRSIDTILAEFDLGGKKTVRASPDFYEAKSRVDILWNVEVIDGPEEGKRFILRRDTLSVIGRGDECDLSLAKDASCSRRHVHIQRIGFLCIMRDLGSKNGTLVNDSKTSTAILATNDRMTLGRSTLQLHISLGESESM